MRAKAAVSAANWNSSGDVGREANSAGLCVRGGCGNLKPAWEKSTSMSSSASTSSEYHDVEEEAVERKDVLEAGRGANFQSTESSPKEDVEDVGEHGACVENLGGESEDRAER
jgi:hypothetical protein